MLCVIERHESSVLCFSTSWLTYPLVSVPLRIGPKRMSVHRQDWETEWRQERERERSRVGFFIRALILLLVCACLPGRPSRCVAPFAYLVIVRQRATLSSFSHLTSFYYLTVLLYLNLSSYSTLSSFDWHWNFVGRRPQLSTCQTWTNSLREYVNIAWFLFKN